MPELLIAQLAETHFRVFLDGLCNSFKALLGGLVLSTVLGVACALLTHRNRGALNRLVRIYITIIRNTPFLVQLYVCYFGLPSLGIRLTAYETGVLALMLNSGAYISDIVKAGLQAVEKGQVEAAEALGMTPFQCFRFIVMPQAIPQIIPAAAGQYLIMFQDTSLMSTISYAELTRSIQDVGSETYLFLEAFIVGGVVYFVVLNVMEFASSRLERRFRIRIPGRRAVNG